MRERIAHHQKADAVPIAAELLALDGTDREAFNFLDGHYRRERKHTERCALLVRTGGDTALPVTARVLRLREAGTLYETRLKDIDGAIGVWRQVLALDDDSDEARRNLKRLYERAQRWDDLATALAAEADGARSDDQRVQLLKRLITLHREQRGDMAAAADVMARLYALQPKERGLVSQLVDAQLQLGRFEEAAPLLERQLTNATSNAQRAGLLRKLAQVQDAHLGDIDRAVETYGRIVDLLPTDSAALRRMEELDRESGNHRRLLSTLERRCRFASDEDAATLLVHMSEIAEQQLGDREMAVAYVGQALSRAPANERVLDAFCGAHVRAELFEVLVDTLREQALKERGRETRIALYRRIARTLADHLNDRVGAAETWQGLLAWREDPEALHFLETMARDDGDDEALVEYLARLAKLEDSDRASARLMERAAIVMERLGRPADAAGEIGKLLDRYGYENAEAFALLERACAAAERYQPLARALEKQMVLREGAARVDVARRLASLYADTMNDPSRALKVLDQWIEYAPADAEPHRVRRPLLEARHQHQTLLETLDALHRLEESPEARAAAAVAAAELCADRMDDVDGAWARLAPWAEARDAGALDALGELATQHDRVDALCELFARLSEYDRLQDVLARAAANAKQDEQRITWLRRLARTRQEYLGDVDGAEQAYVELLEIRDDVEALQFRRGRATQRNDPHLLADCLARLAAMQDRAADKRDLLFELGQLHLERLQEPARATEVLRRIVDEVDPSYQPALDALVDAAARADDHPTLATALERQLALAEDDAARAAIGSRLADLYEGALDNPAQALVCLRRWREAAPADTEVLRRLRRRLEASGHHEPDPAQELLEVLDKLANLEPSHSDQLGARVSAAILARDRLNDPQGAFDRLIDQVGTADPDVDEVLRSLANEPQRFETLLERLAQAQRHSTLVQRIEEQVDRAETGAQSSALRRRAARILAQTLDEPDRAAEHYMALLDQGEDAEALRFMQTRAMAHQDPGKLAEYLRRLAAIEDDPIERRDLLFDHAHVLRAQLDRPEEAARVLRGVVSEYPDFDAALDELSEACNAAGDHNGYAQCLERMLERERDPGAQVEQAQRLVELYEATLNEPARAEPALRRWAAAAPEDATPLRRLRSLLEQPDRTPGSDLLGVLDALARREQAPQARRDAAAAAGTLCATQLDDSEGAWQRLYPLAQDGDRSVEPILHDVAQRAGKLEALCQLYEGQGRYDDLVRVLGERAEQASGEAAVELLRYRARTLRDQLDDDLGAVEAWRELLALGDDAEALQALCDVARREDDAAALEGLLQRLANQLTDHAALEAAQVERARLLADRLEREDEAITLLLEVVRASTVLTPDVVDSLITVCRRRNHYPGLAEGLAKRLDLPTTPEQRAGLAHQLADLYGGPLPDAGAEMNALHLWRQSAPTDPEPRRRLRARLEGASAETEAQTALLVILDELSQTEQDHDAHGEAVRAAGQLCLRRGDVAGALQRLSPRLLADDQEAAHQLTAAANTAELKQRVAGLFVRRAQGRTPDARKAMAHDWGMAARLLEEAGQPAEALEAALRMFALDTNDDAALAHIDRLAANAGAWERLEQVYRRLVRDAPNSERAAALCLRVSRHLDTGKHDPQRALEWALRACRASPGDERALADAERLATAAGSHQDLLFLQEERARNTRDAASRIAYLTSAARTADLGMGDREQALACLVEALAMTVDAPEMAHVIETTAKAMDEARPDLGTDHARRTLARTHVSLATRVGAPEGPKLILRGARLLKESIGDAASAYDVLRQGTHSFPGDGALLDELSAAAIALTRLDGLDAHLARLVRGQADQGIQIDLLRRRATLLSTELQRFDSAARVYGELLTLAPDDAAAWQAQEWCLRKAGRFRELAKLYEHRLLSTTAPSARARLLRDQAHVWEVELRNRVQARQLWEQASALEPNHEDTVAALSRLR